MSNPLLSVIVITYNQEKYIRKCLESILMQKTNFKYEIVVAEDRSPDNTREILVEYKEKNPDIFNLILRDENIGVNMNSALAIAAAKGKYLAFLEGDDFWLDENKLQMQVDILEKHSEYSAVAHNIYYAKPNGEVIKNCLYTTKIKIYTMKDFMNKPFFIHGCSLVARNVFNASGEKYQNLRKSVPTMGDVMTQAILFDSGDVYYIGDKCMSAHRIADKSDFASFSQTNKIKLIEHTYMFKTLTKALEEYFDYKYDFTSKYALRVGDVYFNLIFNRSEYKVDKTKFKELQESLTLKFKLKALKFTIKHFFDIVSRKVRKICKAN